MSTTSLSSLRYIFSREATPSLSACSARSMVRARFITKADSKLGFLTKRQLWRQRYLSEWASKPKLATPADL
eukprot:6492386-Amphidinium_carterae.1